MKNWGTLKVSDIIKPERIHDYEREIKIIWQQLSHISNNLFIIEKIVNFPFHLFLPIDQRTFWKLTSKAYFDSTILAFTTILDEGNKKDSITLRGLKNKVMNSAVYQLESIDLEVSSLLRQKLKSTNFETSIKPFQESIKKIRNQRIAHLDLNLIDSPSDVVSYNIPLEDLKRALEITNNLFQVLGLGVTRRLETWGYDKPRNKTDIEMLLDMIALKSRWFRESNKIDHWYERLNSSDKAVIDEWRRRLL